MAIGQLLRGVQLPHTLFDNFQHWRGFNMDNYETEVNLMVYLGFIIIHVETTSENLTLEI